MGKIDKERVTRIQVSIKVKGGNRHEQIKASISVRHNSSSTSSVYYFEN